MRLKNSISPITLNVLVILTFVLLVKQGISDTLFIRPNSFPFFQKAEKSPGDDVLDFIHDKNLQLKIRSGEKLTKEEAKSITRYIQKGIDEQMEASEHPHFRFDHTYTLHKIEETDTSLVIRRKSISTEYADVSPCLAIRYIKDMKAKRVTISGKGILTPYRYGDTILEIIGVDNIDITGITLLGKEKFPSMDGVSGATSTKKIGSYLGYDLSSIPGSTSENNWKDTSQYNSSKDGWLRIKDQQLKNELVNYMLYEKFGGADLANTTITSWDVVKSKIGTEIVREYPVYDTNGDEVSDRTQARWGTFMEGYIGSGGGLGLHIFSSENIRVRDLTVVGFGGGIRVSQLTNNTLLPHPIERRPSKNIEISGNFIKNMLTDGIGLDGVENCLISDNNISGIGHPDARPLTGKRNSYKITDNVIRRLEIEEGVDDNTLVYLQEMIDKEIIDKDDFLVEIENSIGPLATDQYKSVILQYAGRQSQTIHQDPGYGISLSSLGHGEVRTSRIIITNNHIQDCVRKCINAHSGKNLSIINNEIYGFNDLGIALGSTGQPVTDFNITGNIIKTHAHAWKAQGLTYFVGRAEERTHGSIIDNTIIIKAGKRDPDYNPPAGQKPFKIESTAISGPSVTRKGGIIVSYNIKNNIITFMGDYSETIPNGILNGGATSQATEIQLIANIEGNTIVFSNPAYENHKKSKGFMLGRFRVVNFSGNTIRQPFGVSIKNNRSNDNHSNIVPPLINNESDHNLVITGDMVSNMKLEKW